MSLKSEEVPGVFNVVYTTTLQDGNEIYNVMSHAHQDAPGLIDVMSHENQMPGIYKIVSNAYETVPEILNVVSTTQHDANDIYNISDVPDVVNYVKYEEESYMPQAPTEVFDVMHAPQGNSHMYNTLPTTSEDDPQMFDSMSITKHDHEIFDAVSTTPQCISEIFNKTPSDTEIYNTISETPKMLNTVSTTSQAIPGMYEVVSSTPRVDSQVITTECPEIDSNPIVSNNPTVDTVPELVKIVPTKTRSTPTKTRANPKRTPKARGSPSTSNPKSNKPRAIPSGVTSVKTQGDPEEFEDPILVESQLIELHNGKKLLIVNGYPFYFRHKLKTTPLSRWCCNRNSCNAYVHATIEDNRVVAYGGEIHKHTPTRFRKQKDGKYIKI